MMHTGRRVALLSWLMVPLALAAARADQPAEVQLLRPDSLAGWQYGPATPRGWKIASGRLTGQSGATPLLSGYSFGDFRLCFQWSASGGGVLRIALPDVPEGKGLQLAFGEGDGCARLDDGGKTLAPGVKVGPAAPGKMHTATVDRAGAKLAVSVDGRRLYEIGLKPQRRFGLGLAVEGGRAALADLRLQEPPGRPIFNEKDLGGWWCPGDIHAWKADNKELVLFQHGGNYLRTQKEYANFTLSLEYLIRKRGNSGVGIRTPHDGWPSGDGMELQIEDRPAMDEHATMAVYGNVPPIARADKSEQWNRVVIKADGWMVSAWMNGQLVQQVNTFFHPELKHRNLRGWIGFQDHGALTRFRNVSLLEAPDGTGLRAWCAQPAPLATTTLLDRLMNPGRLSVDLGIRSGVVATRFTEPKTASKPEPKKDASKQGGPEPKDGKKPQKQRHKKQKPPKPVQTTEHVLAELIGPGAVVRVARTNDEGRLAFYFDGEKKPRLECKPADLWRAVPPVGEDRNPVVTCLTYRKGLKIVLRDAEAADYRIDYVTLPPKLKVQSFVKGAGDAHPGFPRAWLSCIAYRLGQGRWGVMRQHDPMPRFASEKKTIEPGKTERLVHVDGAGVVEWLQLNANKNVLERNDLWLEVTVDGEKCPALAAPARFLFPGLAGQGNYGNFVMVERGGAYNRLAMPFGAGITLAAKNTGPKPIQGVGVTLSVLPATGEKTPVVLETVSPKEIADRMRLRGVFRPAGEGCDELAHLDGAGRLVGVVCQQPDGPATGIQSLCVDGRPAPGWQSPTLDSFVGQSGDFRACLSGRHGPLSWRYLLLAPVDFQKSLVVKATGKKLGDRLVLAYMKK